MPPAQARLSDVLGFPWTVHSAFCGEKEAGEGKMHDARKKRDPGSQPFPVRCDGRVLCRAGGRRRMGMQVYHRITGFHSADAACSAGGSSRA